MQYTKGSKLRYDNNNQLIILGLLLAVYTLWVVVKYNSLTGTVGPAIIGDEILYRLYAQRLVEFKSYIVCANLLGLCGPTATDPLYPPGYPLFLAIAGSLSSTNPIFAMKVGNVVASTLVLFPVYGITRHLTGRIPALGAAIVSGAIPYQFVFSDAIMSENLSVTLTLCAFFLALNTSRHRNLLAFGFGLCVATNFLTKFAFLPIAPFPVVIFLVRQWWVTAENGNFPDRILSMIKVVSIGVIGFLIPETAWVMYTHASGIPVTYAFGFQPGLVGPAVAQAKSLHILLVYGGLQLAAIIVAVLPILLPASLYLYVSCRNKQSVNKINFLYSITIAILIVFMWLFISRYMWLAAYMANESLHVNEIKPETLPHTIGERYNLFNFLILLPMAFAFIEYALIERRPNKFYLVVVVISTLYVFSAFLARNALFFQKPWPIPGYITVSWPQAPNIVYGALGVDPLWVAIIATLGILVIVAIPLLIRVNLLVHIRSYAALIFACCIAALTAHEGQKTHDWAWNGEYLSKIALLSNSVAAIINAEEGQKHENNLKTENDDKVYISFTETAHDKISKKIGQQLPDNTFSYLLSFWSGRFVSVLSPEAMALKPNEHQFLISEKGHIGETIGSYHLDGDDFSVNRVK